MKSPNISNNSVLFSPIEEEIIRRESLVVDTSARDDLLSISSKSKKSKNISSSYLKNEKMQ
jgi:hypothetical protein